MIDDVSVYEDDIDLYLEEYIETRGLDRNKISSIQWSAALMYVNRHVFKNNQRSLKGDTGYSYDLDAVTKLLDKYLFLCADFGQRVCVEHFCLLSGINKGTISYWSSDQRRTGNKRAKEIYKRLIESSLMSADDLMISRTGVNSIAYRNSVQERYNRYIDKQKDTRALDTVGLAEKLGIAEQLALPDGQRQEPEPLAKVRHPFDDFDLVDF